METQRICVTSIKVKDGKIVLVRQEKKADILIEGIIRTLCFDFLLAALFLFPAK